MTGKISAKELALANFIISDNLAGETSIKKSSQLHFIANQLSNTLSEKSISYKAAFAAFWINKEKPFSRYNLQTAVLLAYVFLSEDKAGLDLKELAKKIRQAPDVATLAQAFAV